MPTDTTYLPLTAVVDFEAVAVTVTIFGKKITTRFAGLDAATRFANDWNRHLKAEWHRLRATHTAIMESFCDALQKEGVDDRALQNAMDVMQAKIEDDGE